MQPTQWEPGDPVYPDQNPRNQTEIITTCGKCRFSFIETEGLNLPCPQCNHRLGDAS